MARPWAIMAAKRRITRLVCSPTDVVLYVRTGDVMKFMSLLFGFKGRIRRRDWWWASIGLFVAVTAVEFAAHQLLTGKPIQSYFDDANGWMTLQPEPYTLVQWALIPFWVWPTLAISVKRWHDRDRSGWLAVLVVLATCAVIFLQGGGFWISYIAVAVVSFGLNLWQLVECGFLDGTGANKYGPSPKGMGAAAEVF